MKIKEILFQHRNDFTAIMECEHCESTQINEYGYDDAFYHVKVTPKIACINCHKDRSGDVQENPQYCSLTVQV